MPGVQKDQRLGSRHRTKVTGPGFGAVATLGGAAQGTRWESGAVPQLSPGSEPPISGHGPSGREGRRGVDPGARKPACPEVGGARGREVSVGKMITLLLGGARSGKSELAERVAASLGDPVTYVATASAGDDEDFARRIERHRTRRPKDWTTIESGTDLVLSLRGLNGTVLVDSLGTWVASVDDFRVDADSLCGALSEISGTVLVVSEEVGMGVHPASEVGRRFRDALGQLNTRVAAVADDVFLVVAGRVLRLESPSFEDAR